MKRRYEHPGEFLKTGLANGGRIAGDGIVSDNYDDESFPEPRHNVVSFKKRTGIPVGSGTNEDEAPVTTYFIDVKMREE